MIFYDDKVVGVTNSNGNLSISEVCADEDVIFKASFVVTGDLSCDGKVTGLFDLIVLGNVKAKEIDVKGRFVCLGECEIEESVLVQYDIYANSMKAESIVGREQIIAGSIDVGTISSEGSIIVGKVLSVNERAETQQNIICGETAYGSGSLAANCVITGDPLDMDDGDAIETPPCKYEPKSQTPQQQQVALIPAISPYVKDNDYTNYIRDYLVKTEEGKKEIFDNYNKVLKAVETMVPTKFAGTKDAALLLMMIELSNSKYFVGWEAIQQWTQEFRDYFRELIVEKSFDISNLKPIYELRTGMSVWHEKYKRGIVGNISVFKGTKYAEVTFDSTGKKMFAAYDKSGNFKKIEDGTNGLDSGRCLVECNVHSYAEWVAAISALEANKSFLGKDLYNVIYELLIGKMGLKAKYIEDRFKSKGWN